MVADNSSLSMSRHQVTALRGMTPDDLQEWLKTDEAREKAEKWAEDFAAKHPEPIEQEVPVYSFSSYQSDPQISRLQAASGVGDIATVQQILESWEGNKDCFGIALQPSLEGGHIAVALCLLERGVVVNSGDFWLAMQHRSYPFLDLYLRYGYDINDTKGVWQPSPLADTYDDEKMLRWFLDHGADPNAEKIINGGKMGETPLSKAMWCAPFTAIKLLLKYGGLDSIMYGSLIWYAVSRKLPDRLQVLEYLLEKGAASDLNKLMFHNRPEPARQADWVVGRGTPLHASAQDGDLDVTRLFISWGADPLIRDSKGRLAIDEAREQLDTNRTDKDYQGVIDYLSALSNAVDPPRDIDLAGRERL
ncbi:MAG: hypothetical protein L6R35_006931 [Caloplaca aegaea]|nr:MAG: hypothetical protein L6R35_006931 [Caloplaca aegaea]